MKLNLTISKKGILAYLGEFLATALLAFFLYTSPMLAGGIQPFVVAFVFMAIWYIFSPITKVHMNPIVTLGEYLVNLIRQLVEKKFVLNDLLNFFGYLAVQFLAFLAVFPLASWVRWEYAGFMLEKNGYGDTASVKEQYLAGFVFGNSYVDKFSSLAFFLEFFIAFMFVFTFLRVASSEKYKQYLGFIWGLVVFTIIIIATSLTGASFNPWRSLVAAMLEGGTALTQIGLYILAPFSGAIVAALLHSAFQWFTTPSVKKAAVESKPKAK